MPRRTTLAAVLLALTACADHVAEPSPTPTPSRDPGPPPTLATVLVPDLTGLTARAVVRRYDEDELDVASIGRPVPVRCEPRPGVVAAQRPRAGTVVESGTEAHLRLAALDLSSFRGPCPGHELGPVQGADATLARGFYRFAADPTRGAPFVDGGVWTGIEDGPAGIVVDPERRADLRAWRIDTAYAERRGPFSALDVVAASGGWYELHRGVAGTCGTSPPGAPAALAGLRAVTLTAPADTVSSCLQQWAVTLFLDHADRIAGVGLRLGSP